MPRKDPRCRVRAQGRGTVLSLPSRVSTAGVTSVHLRREIQSPVSTKRTGLGPGRVSAMFKPQVDVFSLFLDLRNPKIIKLNSSKGVALKHHCVISQEVQRGRGQPAAACP